MGQHFVRHETIFHLEGRGRGSEAAYPEAVSAGDEGEESRA
jgi:hypothetical protein